LNSRPRLVVYGLGSQDLIQPLLRACQRIDPQSVADELAGTVNLPTHAVHLRVMPHAGSSSVDVEAFEPNVSHAFWRSLLAELRREVAPLPAVAPRNGGMLSVAGLVMLLFVALQVARLPSLVFEGRFLCLWS